MCPNKSRPLRTWAAALRWPIVTDTFFYTDYEPISKHCWQHRQPSTCYLGTTTRWLLTCVFTSLLQSSKAVLDSNFLQCFETIPLVPSKSTSSLKASWRNYFVSAPCAITHLLQRSTVSDLSSGSSPAGHMATPFCGKASHTYPTCLLGTCCCRLLFCSAEQAQFRLDPRNHF